MKKSRCTEEQIALSLNACVRAMPLKPSLGLASE